MNPKSIAKQRENPFMVNKILKFPNYRRNSNKEIKNNIEYCKEAKKRLLREINEINDNVTTGLITQEEYDLQLNQKFNGKTKQQWLDFCNRYIEEKEKVVSDYKKALRKNIYYNVKPLIPISVLLILFTFALFLPLKPTGFITIDKEFNYTDSIDLVVDNNYNYTWFIGNIGRLTSLRLDGSLSKDGYAAIYLEYNDKLYLISDSDRLSEGIGKISGLVVSDIINNDSLEDVNGSKENLSFDKSEPLLNNSLNNKKIIIKALGGGSKPIDKIFEFNISSEFNWDVSYNKVCTKWDVNLVSLCYGSLDCCALIGLESLGEWNSSLYLSYGRYGSGLKNIVRAQIIYANYSLDIEHPYADIIYSDIEELEAEFEKIIRFKDICIETCLLPRFNLTSYKLIFIIENASLRIDNIKYSIEKKINITRNKPELIKEFKNITIYKNEYITINLSEYFYDKDNDKLTYSAYKVDNISIIINDSIATLTPNYNFTGKRYIYFTASDDYYNTTSNVFSVNIIEKPLKVEEVNISEELVKPLIVINKPVRWVKKVNASDSVINLSVNISSHALNVTVRDIKEDRIINENKIKINDRGVIKNYSSYRAEKRIEQINRIKEELTGKKEKIIDEDPTNKQAISKINEQLTDLDNERNRLTGYVVAAEGKGIITKFFEWLFNVEITAYVIVEVENETNTTAVIIEDIVEDVEIEYYTEGPISEEENITNGKRIIISSDIHYEDILAYTYLNDVPKNAIKLYHIINDSRELVSNVSYYDKNNNNLIDYIEWIVSSLSNETYEVIIEITKAEHLDSNRSFISDIYDYVKAKDNNWSEPIYNNEYVRVTFERPLDNTKDITIYARSNNESNSSAEIEVYTKDSDELITKFENISEEGWYKVYLTKLNGSYKTFDLKILNSSVEFDYIVDPKIGKAGNISFVDPTPANNSKQSKTYVEINVSIKANLSEVKFNWNGTNYTIFNDSLVLMFNFDNRSDLGEDNTHVFDVSGKGNNGTVTDAKVNTTDCKYGNCFTFDGNGDYIEIADAENNRPRTYNWSVSFWFWAADANQDGGLVSKGTSESPYTQFATYVCDATTDRNAGKRIQATIVGDNPADDVWWYATSSDIVDGNWHHIVFIRNSTGGTIFADGVLQGLTFIRDNPSAGMNVTVTEPWTIGYGGASGDYFNGTIDEVMIFNRSLSADDVKQLYFTNLYKYDTDKWALYVNQSLNSTNGLDNGTYTYQAHASDTLGNWNSTETRTITIQTWPSSNKFVITNSSGANVASIDDKGDIYLKGTASESQSSLNPTPNSFILQNSSTDVIAYINSTGYLLMLGTITKNSDLSGRTSTNLEFKDSRDDLVAFFDNKGNLKLKGSLNENYADP